MADAFATQTELEALMQRSVSAAAATLVLAGASASIRRYCGWHIAPVEEETLVRDGSGSSLLFLPSLMVVEITSVTDDGDELEEDTDFRWSTAGFLQRVGAFWTDKLRGVVVELSHGYAIVPEDVKGVCLSAAARTLTSPAGVKAEQSSGVMVTFGTPGGLASYETAQLEPYRVKGEV